VNAIVGGRRGELYVGGRFSAIGGQARTGLAAFADPDIIFSDTFGGQ
jgi:hypothetical protein